MAEVARGVGEVGGGERCTQLGVRHCRLPHRVGELPKTKLTRRRCEALPCRRLERQVDVLECRGIVGGGSGVTRGRRSANALQLPQHSLPARLERGVRTERPGNREQSILLEIACRLAAVAHDEGHCVVGTEEASRTLHVRARHAAAQLRRDGAGREAARHIEDTHTREKVRRGHPICDLRAKKYGEESRRGAMQTAQSDGAVFIAHDERVAAHSSRWPHIEKADRALAAAAHLRDCGLLARCIELRGRAATDEELLSVHSQAHLDEVARLSRAARDEPANRSLLEPDGAGGVYYSAQADTAARLATGSVIEAVEAVLTARPERKSDDAQRHLGALTARIEPTASKDAQRRLGARAVGFALVRPPGHHAGADDTEGHRAEGFCFFNSVAVAAAVARRHVERVAILDWDVHHGNGTQRLFYGRSDVLTISLHRPGPLPTRLALSAS